MVENNTIKLTRNEVSMFEFSRTSDKMFAMPGVRNIEIPVEGTGGQHVEITQNFVDAVLEKVPLIAPAEEGIHSVELGNAMLYSSVTGKPVDLPLDGAKYKRMLKKLIRESKFEKKTTKKKSEDMKASFH